MIGNPPISTSHTGINSQSTTLSLFAVTMPRNLNPPYSTGIANLWVLQSNIAALTHLNRMVMLNLPTKVFYTSHAQCSSSAIFLRHVGVMQFFMLPRYLTYDQQVEENILQFSCFMGGHPLSNIYAFLDVLSKYLFRHPCAQKWVLNV